MADRLHIHFTADACILFALMLLLLPLQWFLAVTAAAAFHEVCHGAAILLLGGKISNLSLTSGGAKMGVSAMSQKEELLCALAGPAGGLLLLFFARWIPRTALCAAVQSVWNLLPVYPLDGGRALRCIAQLTMKSATADRFCSIAEGICTALLVGMGVYGSAVLRLGIFPLIPGVFSLLQRKYRKTPCKRGLKRVQ